VDCHRGETKPAAADPQKTKPFAYLVADLQIAPDCATPKDDDALDPAQPDMFPGLQSSVHGGHVDNEQPSDIVRMR
jgi:hypothetical protein